MFEGKGPPGLAIAVPQVEAVMPLDQFEFGVFGAVHHRCANPEGEVAEFTTLGKSTISS
ncbi:hypothetical protein WCU79_11425 [Pectobacterium versatile]|uniref:Uncharacterized protein n=1 Tax=Pectobacterium versatile TaxID=2488639 RepID=A0ABU8JYD4_9GAMM|nr:MULTISPECIES: hypothetical protein [Pectobacterium]UCP83383.1 hypothetical protein LGL95_09090 [Pectobacterium versatile]